MQTSFVYILTNKSKTTLYTGVTNNLKQRLEEYQEGLGSKFTNTFKVHHLLFFEEFTDIKKAIQREKQIKKWSRIKKEELIEKLNPKWELLEEPIIF